MSQRVSFERAFLGGFLSHSNPGAHLDLSSVNLRALSDWAPCNEDRVFSLPDNCGKTLVGFQVSDRRLALFDRAE